MILKTLPSTEDIAGKRILMRVDFDVPVANGTIVDTYRIDATIATIQDYLNRGAKVVIMSHIGSDGSESLQPVFQYLKSMMPISFVAHIVGPEVTAAIEELQNGHCLLLENLRTSEGEKANDKTFAKTLASYGDIFVNEGFPVAHRAHASVVGVPAFIPSYFGPRFVEEVTRLETIRQNQKHPFLFILGGAKFSTKLPLINYFLNKADDICIVGALANQAIKAKGFDVGTSLVDADAPNLDAILNSPNVFIPIDVTVESNGAVMNKKINDIGATDKIVDIGTETVEAIKQKINASALVLWNGPTGIYEEGYLKPTQDLLKALAASSAESVIGGGDTAAIVNTMGMLTQFSFVSTGGGATLDYLANGTLPAIEAIT